MTHATVTHIPKVKESAGNRKITVSSLVNGASSHLTSSKAFGYCRLQIAYSSAVMWNRIEQRAGFGWLKCNVRSVAFTVVQLLLFQSVDICGASLGTARPKKQHYSGSGHMWAAHYDELCWPLTTPALKLQRKQKKTESSKWCLFCV